MARFPSQGDQGSSLSFSMYMRRFSTPLAQQRSSPSSAAVTIPRSISMYTLLLLKHVPNLNTASVSFLPNTSETLKSSRSCPHSTIVNYSRHVLKKSNLEWTLLESGWLDYLLPAKNTYMRIETKGKHHQRKGSALTIKRLDVISVDLSDRSSKGGYKVPQ